MEKQDIKRLFNLIGTLYPSSKQQPRTPADLEAWTLVLEPWAYEDAKQAVVLRARENRFPPDASELVPYLPKPEARKAKEAPMPEPSDIYLESSMRRTKPCMSGGKPQASPPPPKRRSMG